MLCLKPPKRCCTFWDPESLTYGRGPGPRCEQRAAHTRQGSESKTECDVKTAQGYRLAKVACTLTPPSFIRGGGPAACCAGGSM